MANTLGPGAFGAARAVTTRPSIIPDSTGPDTWFIDCSSPTARDGTELRAALLNAFIAQFREIRRANGRPEDNADSMAMRAIRSQRANFVSAAGVAGTANAVTLTFDPAFASIADLLATPIRFLVEQNSTAAVTISVDGLAAQSLVFLDGTAVGNGGLVTGRLIEIMHDGARFVALAGVTAASGHTHPMSDIVGLLAALDGKVAKAGDTMSGALGFANDVRAQFQSTGGVFAAGTSGMQIGKGSDNNGYLDNFNGDLVFRRSGSAELMRLAGNGRIGINTASPLETLDVAGNIRASNNLVSAGGVNVSGSLGTATQVLTGGTTAQWRSLADLGFRGRLIAAYELRINAIVESSQGATNFTNAGIAVGCTATFTWTGGIGARLNVTFPDIGTATYAVLGILPGPGAYQSKTSTGFILDVNNFNFSNFFFSVVAS
jgi:hypothetical protein